MVGDGVDVCNEVVGFGADDSFVFEIGYELSQGLASMFGATTLGHLL